MAQTFAPRPRVQGEAKGAATGRGRGIWPGVVRSAAGGGAEPRTASAPAGPDGSRGGGCHAGNSGRLGGRRAGREGRGRGECALARWVGGVPRGRAGSGRGERARAWSRGRWRGLPRQRAARREHGARSRRARLAGGTVSSKRTRPGARGDGAAAAAGARAYPGADPGAES